MAHPILCIGSVLWDIIGKTDTQVGLGFDCGGHISMIPGGVAMNIAMRLRQFDHNVALLSYLGKDKNGSDWLAEANKREIETKFLTLGNSYPTDRYMAIEVGGNLFAAIADANSLEAADDSILAPLVDGRLGSTRNPFDGTIVLDGNLTQDLLARISTAPEFSKADVRLVPASPGKAIRLAPFIGNHSNATLYVNLEEACTLSGQKFLNSADAAQFLQAQGLKQVIVTNSSSNASCANSHGVFQETPPDVLVKRVTGAGDVFMAAHISAELGGADTAASLLSAIQSTATYISSEESL
jgi:sugar/nucleoside kinase (ribokinase family)